MDTISLPITTLLSSALAVWLLVLSWAVIKGRRSLNLSLGDGGDDMMQRRVRAQGNLVEYAPIFVIMIALAELQGGNAIIVSILAAAFLAGRLAHGYAFAFTEKNMKLRKLGMIATLCGIAATAVFNLVLLAT
ncbi:MAG: MAPEG family protein [Ascidiaceihabitans sp.]|nr:MAPEG family protein [Ascidiaceihabitans sp.]